MMEDVASRLVAEGLVNLTVEGVVDVAYFANSERQIVTTPPLDSTPGPNFTDCGVYQAVANGTGTVSRTGRVRVGETLVVTCSVLDGYFPTISGFPQVTCLEDGQFSQEIRCRGCGPGQYLDVSRGEFNTVCRQCEEGAFSSAAAATTCELCPPGFYSNGTGTRQCLACNAGTSSTAFGGRSPQECFCLRGTYGNNNGPCRPCAVGTYADLPGLAACRQCPERSITVSEGAASQEQCLCIAGHQRNADEEVCEECPHGFYKPATVLTRAPCTPCPERATTPDTASTLLSQCQCEPGSVLSGAECVSCAAGTFKSFRDNSTCSLCPVGFIAEERAVNCTQCPHGTYAPQGSRRCLLCPRGQYAVSPASACASCSPGKFIDSLGSACFDCGPGRISGTGAAQCEQCFAGSFAPPPGQASCSICSPGTFSRAAAGVCLNCADGFYNPQSGQSVCKQCAYGQMSVSGASACSACPAGKYSDGETFGLCRDCAAGTFAAPGMSACTNCPLASYQPAGGQSTCLDCPPRSSTPSEGSTTIAECTCNPGLTLTLDGECIGYWASGIQHNVDRKSVV